ncbi:ras-GEF domain-containing family member 1B-like [Rhodnius prolixus]|uniref:ras-GEF domain-containing family member 1B-like n=1 Tax=Rhodnius prolixus TaxID=13249 RepID=UPI003D18FC67
MAMYYYACRLSAACSARRDSPPPLAHAHHNPNDGSSSISTVATISHQPCSSTATSPQAVDVIVNKAPIGGGCKVEGLHVKPQIKHCSKRYTCNNEERESVMYREGNLVSGRLEALIQHMVPTADYYPDRAFLFAFLLTSRLFVKPHDLLGQISANCREHMKVINKEEEPSSHLVRLLAEWSETFPYDFRDERVMSHVRELAHRCVSIEEGEIREEISLVLHNLLDKLTKLEQYEAFLHSINKDAVTDNVDAVTQTEVSEVCGSAVSLAQQLTHIELERLSYIGPEEFVQAYINEGNAPSLGTDFEPRITTNFEVYVGWTNRLSRLVVTDVCRLMKSKRQRVRVLQFWVDTAKECFTIGNFNSLKAILNGLNSKAVARLKKTWSKLEDREQLTSLETQMCSLDDHASYRALLRAAATRFNKDDSAHCTVIPVFSILTADLHVICKQCQQTLPNGHINFEKFWQLAKQVTEFITWKQVHCPFPKAAKVITYLQATPVLNEEASLLASYDCESPENPDEADLNLKLTKEGQS